MNSTDFIFLDDIRTPMSTRHVQLPRGNWIIVRDYAEFCNTIRNFFWLHNKLPDFISFDHDLAEEHYGVDPVLSDFKEKTGYDCAKWLLEFCRKHEQPIPKFMCHSMNPVGRENIERLLNRGVV